VTSRSKVFRYLKKAKQSASYTLQLLREVVIERIEPEAWELITLEGLSPPGYPKLKALEVWPLWEAFSILLKGASHTGIPLSTLLARAHERSTHYRKPFLFEVR